MHFNNLSFINSPASLLNQFQQPVAQPNQQQDQSFNFNLLPVKLTPHVLILDKNQINTPEGSHISEAQASAAKVVRITEDCDVLDAKGGFIFGVRYNVCKISSNARKDYAALIPTREYRGAAAGPLDIDTVKNNYGKNKEITFIKNKENIVLSWKHNNVKSTRTRYNKQAAQTFGRTKFIVDLDTIKQEELRTFKPILRITTIAFIEMWKGIYQEYERIMHITNDHKLFITLDNEVYPFSTLAVNVHQIDEKGCTVKDSRAATHIDKHHDNSVEVMLCLKENINGGDLFFPEYGEAGCLIQLRDQSIVAFKGSQLKHAVTSIRQDQNNKRSLRITFVAHVLRSNKTPHDGKERVSKNVNKASVIDSARQPPSQIFLRPNYQPTPFLLTPPPAIIVGEKTLHEQQEHAPKRPSLERGDAERPPPKKIKRNAIVLEPSLTEVHPQSFIS